ncbi:HIT family protein [Sphingobacterium sp. UT-1RO-CII-1]|uniref:HIT family protein n=1 Tax=Sphingobacterium sp. UT-1RO-CII-1 TaxID=2995225 RepID=UPI00227B979E|nr:HIT family protein [Sphingobacterium sp. UT-1RO-CII-1]MCY4778538.1 HIT family protein [Sphingobacterium sp. UT-1RO-CII-1]
MEGFKNKFQTDRYTVFQVGNWIISLRPQQVTIGSLIVFLNRPCTDLSNLTEEESLHLGEVFKFVNKLLKSSFLPDKINYLALMMVDDQVHFHVIPRYKTSVVFEGKQYEDIAWPKPPNLMEALSLSDDVVESICEYLKISPKSE